jgi:4-amino-4-deoxy-L-arabinose transferase-like glycosyltransferase
VAALTVLTLILRTWRLDAIPPWLWWDEASQGLDARELLGGVFRVFFPSAMGKEPLYIYLTAPFVAAWDGQAFAVRLAGALTGALMIPALYAAGRALWPRRPTFGAWAGLAAAAFWATNFWPQSINRIGFQVNPFPLIFTLALVAWLNYVRRPTRRRAVVFGLLAGLTLTTYIVARITPLLWLLLYLALPRLQRLALRGTLRWAILAGCLAIAPLAGYFALHPDSFFQRVGTLENWQAEAQRVTFDAAWLSVRQLFGGFLGLYGDPIARHNVPDRPPFSLPLAALFAVGGASAGIAALRRRDRAALTLWLWWLVASIPFLTSVTNAPHFTRLFGALPAALLLAAAPIGWLAERLDAVGQHAARFALGSLVALLVIFEGTSTIRAYFVTWVQEPSLYEAFQGDTWTFAEQVAQTPGALGVTPLNPGYGLQSHYAFQEAPILQLDAGERDVAGWLAARLGDAGGRQIVTPVWTQGANLTADVRGALRFYLAREGRMIAEQPMRGFSLLIFALGERPQFAASGQRAPLDIAFPPDLILVEGRWGAAYPNPDRNIPGAAAGTPLWAILTWRLDRPLPDARVAVDLLDAAGHRLVSSETPLMDERQRALRSWPTGETFQTYHLVTVPGTQPAGELEIAVRVYDVRTLEPLLAGADKDQPTVALGSAAVTPAVTPIQAGRLSLDRPLRHAFAPGVELLGADAWPVTFPAGQTLPIKFYWQIISPFPQAVPVSLRLNDTEVHADMTLPAATPVGHVIHTYADLHLPGDLPAGDYELQLVGPNEGTQVTLGPLTVTNRPRNFAAPPPAYPHAATFGDAVRLLGLTGASSQLKAGEQAGQVVMPVTAGEPLTLTLAWQALGTPPRDLVRFVHMLGSDGRPVAQQDSPPCAGACPAPSWLPGEILIDQVRLEIAANLPEGAYPLAVGWYDAETFQRLPAVADAASQQPGAGGLVRLPFTIRVTP